MSRKHADRVPTKSAEPTKKGFVGGFLIEGKREREIFN
jgi:hypothetical protein